MNQFMGSIREIYHESIMKYSTASRLTAEGRPSDEDVDENIYKVLDKWRNKGFYGVGFHQFFPDAVRIKLKQLTSDLTDILILETKGIQRTAELGYSSPYIALSTLFAGLFRRRYKGIIKTLPMFNISNVSNLNKPVLMQINNTNLVQTPTDMDRSSARFFSGIYKILGLKHTIKPAGATSEFVVVKDIQAEMNDADD